MNQRMKFASAGIGLVLILGSMAAFPHRADAAPGDLRVVSGTITLGTFGPMAATGPATGGSAPVVSPWTGGFTANTALACIKLNFRNTNDTITWTAGPPWPVFATQTLAANTVITIDSTTCPVAPQAVCILTVTTNKVLTATDWQPVIINGVTYLRGTFNTAPGGTVGADTLANDPNTNNCFNGSPSLGGFVNGAVSGGTAAFAMSVVKQLQL